VRWNIVVIVVLAALCIAVGGCVDEGAPGESAPQHSSIIYAEEGVVHIAELSFATPTRGVEHPTSSEFYQQLYSEMASTPLQYPLTVVDDVGEVIVIPEKPERIVSLAPSNTEILFAIGAGDRVVGVTEFCSYPPEASDVPKTGGYATPSIERIISMEPDMVFAAYGVGEENINALKSNGLTVVSLYPSTLDDVFEDVLLAGVVCDELDNASRLVVSMIEQVDEVKLKTANATTTPRVMYTIWEGPYVAGNGTFASDMIAIAGGENIADGQEGYYIMSMEDAIASDPEVIITTGMGNDTITYGYIMNESRFSRTSARLNDRVYKIDSDVVDRAGPRVVQALAQFSRFIHPELYQPSR